MILKEKTEYDKIIADISGDDRFQMRFGIIFVSILSFFTGLQYMNKFISVAIPDHWCYVPGREKTNYTVEEWKNITIPMEIGTNGVINYSKCTRFGNLLHNKSNIIECDNGWTYDQTWYKVTAPSENDWVCDKYLISTNVLAINRGAEMIGTFIFGQMADNLGRQPIFFISLILVLIGRLSTVFTSSWIYVFYTFSFISSLTCSSIFQSTFIIAMEISQPKNRAIVGTMWGCGWGLGLTISPLIMWWQRYWTTYCLIVTVPIAIFLFSHKWMIESPRWLVSRGRHERCMKILQNIAKTNKIELPNDIPERLIRANNEEIDSNIYTILSLFSSAQLAKNIIIIVYGITTIVFIYSCLIIGVNTLNGNPYLTYVIMGLTDLPVIVLNKHGCDRYGRKPMVIFSFLFVFIGCLTMVFCAFEPSKSTFMIIAVILTKSCATMTYATLYLLLVEICPTCVRQSGASFAAIISNCFAILGPYIVALGLTVNLRLPYVIYVICALLAVISCMFLPETFGYQLPDSLEDAAKFGADQTFWGRPKNNIPSSDETEIPLKNIYNAN